MKLRHAIILLLLLMVGIGSFYLDDYQDRNIVVMKNGTVITVDEIWKSGRFILYKIDDEVFTVNRIEVDIYGKPNSKSMLKHAKFKVSLLLISANDEFKDFANNTTVSFGQRSFWVIAILATTVFCIILLMILHLVLKNRQPAPDPVQPTEVKQPAKPPNTDADEGITPSDIISYFLNLFRLQIGADPDAPMKTNALMENASGSNTVYELRTRRMDASPHEHWSTG
jgi:hypothetical protein